ncbi:MAG: hypothetical protein RLZZ385_1874 [Pseudomonadota bacterium]|jgi:hypothetical protein
MKRTLPLTCTLLALASPIATADSLIDGVYFSASGDNGRGACQLTITSLGDEPKYGDQMYMLESSGEGACEWSAIGVSKNFAITAGSVTSGGTQTFVKLTFPFGPAGKRVEVAAFDADGTPRNKELFMQTQDQSRVGE